jgi:hypothetical protein
VCYDDHGAGVASATLTDALDVVHADVRWRALHAPLGEVTNLARSVFAHPSAPWFYVDPALVEVAVVAQLRKRSSAGGVRVRDLIADLSGSSVRFRALWNGLAVAHRLRGPYEVRSPDVGLLALQRCALPAAGGGWRERIAPQDAATADALALLDLT